MILVCKNICTYIHAYIIHIHTRDTEKNRSYGMARDILILDTTFLALIPPYRKALIFCAKYLIQKRKVNAFIKACVSIIDFD